MCRFVLFAFAAAAVGAAGSATASEEIIVTRESSALPSGCTPREAAALLIRFTDAVSRGDRRAIKRAIAVEDPPGRVAREPAGTVFRWYSVTEGGFRHTALFDRSDLFAYFAERHRHNERMELIAVDVGRSWVPGGAGIGYTLRRDADDLPAGLSRLAHGKGEIDCAAQRIYLWSMGQDEHVQLATPCPRPPGWTAGSAVIACARSADDLVERTGRNARAVVPEFQIIGTSARLPRRCGPRSVAARIRSALAAFNAGHGAAFARHFSARAYFRPYETELVGHGAIAGFVRSRYEAGDAWTGTSLHAPRRPLRQRAIYRLDFLFTAYARPLDPVSAKVVVDCRSGLITTWVGPGVRQPD